MPTADMFDYLNDDSVTLSGIPSDAHPDGKEYEFKSPDAATGMRLAVLYDVILRASAGLDVKPHLEALKLDEESWMSDINREILGATLDELVADGVSWTRIRKVAAYLLRYFVTNDTTLPSGESAARPNRAARRAKTKKPGTRQASPAGSTTRAKGRTANG